MSLGKRENLDVVVIGGGPAGASSALWATLLTDYKICIIEQREQLGGQQNDSPYDNRWIAVLPGLKGQQVAEKLHENIFYSEKIPCHFNSTVYNVTAEKNGYRVQFATKDGVEHNYFSPIVIVASGVKPATGGLVASKNILIGPGNQITDYPFKDKSVAILGGGDSAFENYGVIQKQKPECVHIYAQSDEQHSLKARVELLKRVPEKDIRLHQGALKINEKDCTINGRKYDAIVALYGWSAHFPFFKTLKLELNERGFIKTNPETAETSLPGIYAIGEVARRTHPCCVTAMADGVVAAKAIQKKYEANQKLSLPFFNSPITKRTEQSDIQTKTSSLRSCL